MSDISKNAIQTRLKNGLIAIPQILMEEEIIKKNTEITVVISPGTNDIVLRNDKEPGQENRAVVNKRGAFWLPVEIKNILGIRENDLFMVYAGREKEVILTPVPKGEERQGR
ncbi:hypothetical protein [Alteribacter natronophilus]|uniref:hypothetical protein n=1 Tax=Alteribacter natronophilus TaxID=2583810 RepID=UPI00110D95C1|nr:hypothetical protein [Alteribacter natronophilus]TMW73919.1 hypothetical protein FGB90_06510 [Alteribacter natronophilus]